MIKIQKGNQIIMVTKGAYENMYKGLGFKPVEVEPKFDVQDAIEIPFESKEDKPQKKNKKSKKKAK